ncbi:VgrG-related protein [Streptomyces sp. NPDC090021]|uniref:VgrG-related protein n=1 Tax=Streptomyces sp. NPDC090021 TaxID=3365919 RepID=UPI00382FF47D
MPGTSPAGDFSPAMAPSTNLVQGPVSVRALVTVGTGQLPLPPQAESQIIRVIVDTHVHLPGMFEITFLDEDGTVADEAGLAMGTPVKIEAGAAGDPVATHLISGEVTAVEAVCEGLSIHTVIRGYERTHRLQRARRTRAHLNKTDSDIATDIARQARIPVGRIDHTRIVHAHMPQVAQTDWDFLQERAREIGYETGVEEGSFYFRKATVPAPGPVRPGLAPGQPQLEFRDNLLTFLPRITGAELAPRVEVRTWNPATATVVVGRAPLASGTAELDETDVQELAGAFAGGPVGAAGAAPQVVANRPVGSGANRSLAADQAAAAAAERLASAFAEAEGHALGDPAIQAGRKVTVSNVPRSFRGTWTVTNARHVFCDDEGGYRTRFWVSGRQDRSLLGLASSGAPHTTSGVPDGLLCGIVTDVGDPTSRGRVRVSLPLLDPDFVTDWARVVQPGAGRRSGALFLPEPGDEVLVGFECGDMRRPYVLGGLLNDHSAYTLGTPPVRKSGAATHAVVRRGLVSPTGIKLAFLDDSPPGSAAPRESAVVLGDANEDLALRIDHKAGEVTLTCRRSGAVGGKGRILLSCPDGGAIEVDAGDQGSVALTGGTVSVKAGRRLELHSGGDLTIDGRRVKITGTPIELN